MKFLAGIYLPKKYDMFRLTFARGKDMITETEFPYGIQQCRAVVE